MNIKATMCLFGMFCIAVLVLAGMRELAYAQGDALPEISAASSSISPDHPEVEDGVSCVDCHFVKLDAQTTATKVWLSGDYLKYSAGDGIMSQEKLKQEIVTIIGGRKHNRTFVLGTCINNIPLTTTADFVLDQQTMTLYGMHEKGTTKLFHIQQNPRVSLNWHEDFKSWGKVLCVQFIGHAVLLDGADPEFDQVLNDCIPYEQLAAEMKISPARAREMVKAGMLMSKIRIDLITVNNSAFEQKGLRKYQRWERPGALKRIPAKE